MKRKMKHLMFFPAKFLIDNTFYYYIDFVSTFEINIREDGTVPPIKEIEKVYLYANGYNASIHF